MQARTRSCSKICNIAEDVEDLKRCERHHDAEALAKKVDAPASRNNKLYHELIWEMLIAWSHLLNCKDLEDDESPAADAKGEVTSAHGHIA